MDKRQKKIIFSSFDDINNPYYGGGGARSIHEVAKRLSKEYQVFVITGKYPGSINETVDNVIYERVGLSFLPPKINQGFFHFLLVYKTLTKNYDLWIENFTPPTSTSFLPLFTRKPVIGLVHMLSGEDMQLNYKVPFKFIQYIGLKFYDYFIAVNKKDIDKIKSINPKANFINIPNGIQIPRSITSTKNNILFLGRIEVDQKGLDLLIKAYSNIADKTTSNLIIAGSGTDIEVKKLQKLLQNFHLNGKAKLLGRVDEKEKNKLLRKSALVVIPSRYETFSVTALEGLSYGAPIVSFDLPGLEWIPDNLAYKTKSFNIEDFSKNILKALKEEQTATSKRQKRINFAKNYDWQRIEKMYKSYIDQILI